MTFSVAAVRVHRSALLCRQCSMLCMLCTSGFVDDVMFSHNTWSLRRGELFTVTRQAAPLNCAPGGEVCYCRLPCYDDRCSTTSTAGWTRTRIQSRSALYSSCRSRRNRSWRTSSGTRMQKVGTKSSEIVFLDFSLLKQGR